MPLEDILKGIREKAGSSCDEIVKAAEEKARERLRSAEKEAGALAAGVVAESRARAAALEFIAKSRADSQARQMVLREKQALLSEVFDRALESLGKMPGEEYRALLLKVITETAAGGEEVVLGREDDRRAGADFASAANEALRKAGKPGVTVSFSAQSLGGGLLLRKGGILTNVTFPAMLKKLQDELEIDVAAVLFGDK